MSEGELHVPRLGRLPAAEGFRLVAAMNPFDAVGTARISAAVYDRTCRLSVGYQDAADEASVVAQAIRSSQGVPPDPGWIERVVAVVRATRTHPDLRIGSSVRGAIDTVLVAGTLAGVRGTAATDPTTGLDAALVGLSGRVRVREGTSRSSEEIVRELWEREFGRPEREASPRPAGQEQGKVHPRPAGGGVRTN